MQKSQIRRPRSAYKPSPILDEAIQLVESVSTEAESAVAPTAQGSPDAKTPGEDSGIGMSIYDPDYEFSWPETVEQERKTPRMASPNKKVARKVPQDNLVFGPDLKRQLARQNQAKRRASLAQGNPVNTARVQLKKREQKEKVLENEQLSQVDTPVIHDKKTTKPNTADPVQAPSKKEDVVKCFVKVLGQRPGSIEFLKLSTPKQLGSRALKARDVQTPMAAEKRRREDGEESVEAGGPPKRAKVSPSDAPTKTVTPSATTAEEKAKTGEYTTVWPGTNTIWRGTKGKIGKRTKLPAQKAPIKEARKKIAAGEKTPRKPKPTLKELYFAASKKRERDEDDEDNEDEEESQQGIKKAKSATLSSQPSSGSSLMSVSPSSSKEAVVQAPADTARGEARKAKAIAAMAQYSGLQVAKKVRKQ